MKITKIILKKLWDIIKLKYIIILTFDNCLLKHDKIFTLKNIF